MSYKINYRNKGFERWHHLIPSKNGRAIKALYDDINEAYKHMNEGNHAAYDYEIVEVNNEIQ